MNAKNAMGDESVKAFESLSDVAREVVRREMATLCACSHVGMRVANVCVYYMHMDKRKDGKRK
jgi:hypothetical protein